MRLIIHSTLASSTRHVDDILTVVNVATIVQKKIWPDNLMSHNNETSRSCIANKRPPTGAPKAEATPEPIPAEIKFRLWKNEHNMLYTSGDYK